MDQNYNTNKYDNKVDTINTFVNNTLITFLKI